MNLRQLEYFRVLAETEHMTSTAQMLNTTQPNLSHSMNELEKELQVKLFEKQGRNIKLTKYGKYFYQYVVRSLDEIALGEQGIKELLNPETGKVDFGFVYSMGQIVVPKLMHDFKCVAGNENIEFTLMQGNSAVVLNALIEGKIDIGIASKVEGYENVVFEQLIEQNLVLAVPENHPLAQYDEIDLLDTLEYQYITFHPDNGARPFIDSLFDSISFQPQVAYEVEEDITFAGFVGYGHGIGVVPNFFMLSSYPVKILKIKNKYPPRYLYLVTMKDAFLTPATQKFITYIQNISQNDKASFAQINGINI